LRCAQTLWFCVNMSEFCLFFFLERHFQHSHFCNKWNMRQDV
jgi:hypothetical protein